MLGRFGYIVLYLVLDIFAFNQAIMVRICILLLPYNIFCKSTINMRYQEVHNRVINHHFLSFYHGIIQTLLHRFRPSLLPAPD
jgi:hypothetical protein